MRQGGPRTQCLLDVTELFHSPIHSSCGCLLTHDQEQQPSLDEEGDREAVDGCWEQGKPVFFRPWPPHRFPVPQETLWGQGQFSVLLCYIKVEKPLWAKNRIVLGI